jgi:hypothetical protein
LLTAKASTDLSRIALAVNACQDDQKVFKRSVPEDIRETAEKDTVSPAVPVRVRQRALGDEGDCIVHGLPKLAAKALTLTLIPVLDRYQVELCRSTEEDGERQRGRCSRRALTSDQGL